MKNSILAFLLMLPMLSFGQPVQLTVFYKQSAAVGVVMWNKKMEMKMSYSFDPKDKVTFDQLPEQIRRHYQGLSDRDLGPIGLQETQAYVMLPMGRCEYGFGRVNVWEKKQDGWVLVEEWMAS